VVQGETPRPVVETEDIEDFFENAALSLHWVGPDGTILRANKFELDFLGYEREEYEGHNITEFHADADVIAEILDRLTRGEAIHDYPARMLAKDGSIKHVEINSNVRWHEQQFVHTRCFTRDVTDRVAMARELEQLNHQLELTVAERTAELQGANEQLQELLELKDRFVAVVSHELRTPLTSISGFSLTMERFWDSLPDGQKRDFVEIIGRQSQRLSRLVSDLLTVSRLTSGTYTLNETRFQLRVAVDNVLRELGVEAQVDVDGALYVNADEDAIAHILVNLLTNAQKYGQPPFAISARADVDNVELRVADSGPGVETSFVPRLFDEYSRSEEGQSGAGLGLAIVRWLAEAHAGSAWYEANQPTGAVFAVRLPAGL
jgi:PAS domain S-box-containing protein